MVYMSFFLKRAASESGVSGEDARRRVTRHLLDLGLLDFPSDHQLTAALHREYSQVFGVTDQVLTEMTRDRDFVQDKMTSSDSRDAVRNDVTPRGEFGE